MRDSTRRDNRPTVTNYKVSDFNQRRPCFRKLLYTTTGQQSLRKGKKFFLCKKNFGVYKGLQLKELMFALLKSFSERDNGIT